MVRFDPLGQAMQRQRRTQPNRGVIRRETQLEIIDIHGCQFRLTWLDCQPKLTFDRCGRLLEWFRVLPLEFCVACSGGLAGRTDGVAAGALTPVGDVALLSGQHVPAGL